MDINEIEFLIISIRIKNKLFMQVARLRKHSLQVAPESVYPSTIRRGSYRFLRASYTAGSMAGLGFSMAILGRKYLITNYYNVNSCLGKFVKSKLIIFFRNMYWNISWISFMETTTRSHTILLNQSMTSR